MKLTTLTKALEQYILSAELSSNERQDALDALAECHEVAERFDNRDLWKDTVYLVSSDGLSDLLNIATYDIHGKRARIHEDDMQFDYYAYDVRQLVSSDLTNRVLQLGYDIVHDLWYDNDANGDHNPDGTFKRK